MANKNKPFERKLPSIEQLPKLLILCEDSESAKVYFDEAKHDYRLPNITVKHEDTCPKKSVEFAIKKQNEYDKIYCCIDGGDEHGHGNFDAALELAKNNKNNIQIIASYPCFEFWLLLHFEKKRPGYTQGKAGSKAVITDLNKKDGMANYDKSRANTKGLFKQLKGRLDTAIANAQWAKLEAEKDNNKNPSTDVYRLLEQFKSLELK
ncbi:MAG: hypothetical protein RL344_1513 [Pseudomonadota bacterium]|jgi:hypothetical protein